MSEPKQTEKLYKMSELAKFCGRSLQVLREYYADGILPDPRYTKTTKRGPNGNGKDRRFTMSEMEQIKNFFGGVRRLKRGTVEVIKKRAQRRKRIMEGNPE